MASQRSRPSSSGHRRGSGRSSAAADRRGQVERNGPKGIPAGTVIVLLVLACIVLVEIWLLKVNWATVRASTRNTLLAVAWCLVPLIATGLGIGSSIRYQRQQQRNGR